ncbi:hypothetical protein FRC07_013345, partial [Ceratobasidium sp. 392]
MPTLAGFWISHQGCREWLKKYHRDVYDKYPTAGASAVQMKITRPLLERGFLDVYELDLIPPPGQGERDDWGLMLVVRSSIQKLYIAARPDPKGFDMTGKDTIKRLTDLDVEWRVLWWSSGDPDMQVEIGEVQRGWWGAGVPDEVAEGGLGAALVGNKLASRSGGANASFAVLMVKEREPDGP